MVAALDTGIVRFRAEGREARLFVSGGFAEVRENTVRIVTEAGEKAEEIDEARAREAEQRARERLASEAGGEPIDMARAEAALQRAIWRLRTRGHSEA